MASKSPRDGTSGGGKRGSPTTAAPSLSMARKEPPIAGGSVRLIVQFLAGLVHGVGVGVKAFASGLGQR